MKRFTLIFLLLFTLAGCQSKNNVPESASATVQVMEADNTDISVPSNNLTDNEQPTLSEFLPILAEGKKFKSVHMPYGGETANSFEEKSLAEILQDIDPDYSSDKIVQSLAFCDVTGDGQTDIAVLLDHPAGFYCLLCKDGNDFYGVYMPVRWFEGLRENGVFFGSGGAETAAYERLRFEDGIFSTEILGRTDMGYYEAEGKEVSQEEFEAWLDDTLAEEVVWYEITY